MCGYMGKILIQIVFHIFMMIAMIGLFSWGLDSTTLFQVVCTLLSTVIMLDFYHDVRMYISTW